MPPVVSPPAAVYDEGWLIQPAHVPLAGGGSLDPSSPTDPYPSSAPVLHDE